MTFFTYLFAHQRIMLEKLTIFLITVFSLIQFTTLMIALFTLNETAFLLFIACSFSMLSIALIVGIYADSQLTCNNW